MGRKKNGDSGAGISGEIPVNPGPGVPDFTPLPLLPWVPLQWGLRFRRGLSPSDMKNGTTSTGTGSGSSGEDVCDDRQSKAVLCYTTLMVRNVPPMYTEEMLMEEGFVYGRGPGLEPVCQEIRTTPENL